MSCPNYETISSLTHRQGRRGLSGAVVAQGPRISSIQLINVGFNRLAAAAVWSNG